MPIPDVAAPISRAKTSDVVLETLRGWIVDGVLGPRETLRDIDLATSFGVSRTPVREALLRLEREGLVESQPGRWTRVTSLDAGELARVYPVWIELEALAARR
jgi:DNA-binding GntR family transcriptional regulator